MQRLAGVAAVLPTGPARTAGLLAGHLPIRTMPLFWKPYQSEATQFIEELKRKDPSLESRQREGRSLLWDREQDAEAQAEFKDAQVPQQSYVYQTKA